MVIQHDGLIQRDPIKIDDNEVTNAKLFSSSYSKITGLTADPLTIQGGCIINGSGNIRTKGKSITVRDGADTVDLGWILYDGSICSTIRFTLPIKATGGDPGSPVTGDTYINTSDKKIRTYNGAAWVDLGIWV